MRDRERDYAAQLNVSDAMLNQPPESSLQDQINNLLARVDALEKEKALRQVVINL